MLEVVDWCAGSPARASSPDIRGQGHAARRDPPPVGRLDQAPEMSGWAPQFDLEGGLRRTVDWYRQYLGGAA